MKVLRWGVCALAALLMTAGSSFANDSEIDAMKAAMDNMKQEMDAMRSTMSAEREAMRESAGGAPEALRSKKGNATVRIGGKIAVRYRAQFSSNEVDAGAGSSGGEYGVDNGWEMDTASVTFDFQINEDLSAYIDIRPTKFDKAYFQWNNIGGTGLGAQVGFIGIPCGMYDTDWSPATSILILNPATKSNLIIQDTQVSPGVSTDDDLTRMGVKLYYELDQFKITGTIYNNNAGSDQGDDATLENALSESGEARNYGINHSLMLEYSPAFLEGLHFSFTYVGDVDFGQGVSGNSTANSGNGYGTAYSPTFDLGVAYVADKFAVWATADYTINPGFYSNTWAINFQAGANYNITERLGVSAAFDMSQGGASNDTWKGYTGGTHYMNVWGYRAQFGAKYTFCNGVWVRANYGHTWYGYNQGSDSDNNEWTRGKDEFIFETGVAF